MPPEKRTRTGKARGGRKKSSPPSGAPAPKRMPPTPLLVAWIPALIFLVCIVYLARESRRLPELPADLTTNGTKVPSAPSGTQANPASPKQDLTAVAEQPEGNTGSAHTRNDSSVESQPGREIPQLASIPKLRIPRPQSGILNPDITPKLPKVSIVIDDLGPDVQIAKQFASLPFPVTLSILPHQTHSREIAELAHKAGREVILHLPMEPLSSWKNPGRGALLLSMSIDEIRQNIRTALNTSPFFDGVNNHMGSKVTRDAKMMKTILSELKARDLFFIDSMTTSDSKGWEVAQQLRIPSMKRDIFLDEDPSEGAIRSQISKLMKIAKTRGTALAIGHPHKTTLRSLQEAAAHLQEERIEIVAARDLVNR